MARIPYFDPAAATPLVKKVYARLPDLNIFRMMGHAGTLMDGFSRMADALLNHGEVDPLLREIAIIRIGRLCGSAYEVDQHERIALRLGADPALLKAIAIGPEAPGLSDLQRMVLRLTDDLAANTRASDATFEPLRQALSYRALQELVFAIGFYAMVSMFLETFDVELEAGNSPMVNVRGETRSFSAP